MIFNSGTPKKKAKAEPKKAQSPKAEPPATATGENVEIAALFTELADFEFKKGEKFKGAGYKKVAAALLTAEKVTSGKEAQKLKGIGKSSGEKIQEFLDTGKVAKLEEYRTNGV